MAPLALIIAPFWRQPFHLGHRRIDRYRRWLNEVGWEVTLVRAGETAGEELFDWGRELTVRDPLGLHPNPVAAPPPSLQRREYGVLTHAAALLAFNPDPGIAWARRAAADPRVRAAAARADLVLASSPPESAHLAALPLARLGGARLLVDQRDGWLDEPLKPALSRWRLQRWREARLERRVLAEADRIFVSSPQWQTLLLERYPQLAERVTVLTNCYPPGKVPRYRKSPAPGEELRLLYAGQFTGSKFNNRPDLLFGPLLEGLRAFPGATRTLVRGRFTRLDLQELSRWRRDFAEVGHRLEFLPPIEDETLRKELSEADGLLLLSATRASLPAKLFDYLPAGGPILAVTPEGSAVWEVGAGLPQMFRLAPGPSEAKSAVTDFLTACRTGVGAARLPDQFQEDNCRKLFYAAIEPLVLPAGTVSRKF